MRAFIGLLTALLLVGVLVGTGSAIYNQGVTAGINAAEAGEAAGGGVRAEDESPYIGGPVAFGIGQLVGLLFSVLLVVIIVGLARAAFGIGRHGPDGGGWGHGARRDGIEEWHRELHRREQAGGEQTPAGA